MTAKRNEPRAHHFVPQFWMAGFTDTGQKDAKLWVTDLKRKKQWQCKPSEAGHRRDFNRIDHPSLSDPFAIETVFSNIENQVAPVFNALCRDRRGPKDEVELGTLVEYLAVQWIRVPAFRSLVDGIAGKLIEERLTPESWLEAMQKSGVSAETQESSYEKVRELISGGKIVFSSSTGSYLKHGALILGQIVRVLERFRWNWLLSQSGQFIGSDNPVSIDGPLGEPIGFSNADQLFYPVNRFLLLYATQQPVSPPKLTTKLIARQNTFAMMCAQEQVYSHRPDFHWLDRNGKCVNDWTLFSRNDFPGSTNEIPWPPQWGGRAEL